MDPGDLGVTPDAYFSLLIHAEKFLLMTFDDTDFQNILRMYTQNTDGRTEGQADMEVKIVI